MRRYAAAKIFLLFLFMAASVHSRIVSVTTVSQVKTAIQSMVPGDTIKVAIGVYDLGGYLSVTRSGKADSIIVIRAKNRNQVTFTNNSYFTFKQVAYITIEGFIFTSKDGTVIKTESCNNIRITRNIFRVQETASLKWILIGGTYNQTEPNSHHNRIDHNLFEEKHQLGNIITIDGSPSPTAKSSQYDRIDHNHFRNVGPRADNGMETIRVGWSAMSMSSGYTTIEYNLFENCDGDPEIVSVKTCDNIIRYNTFRESSGSLCLRHGNRSVAEGNFFIGNRKTRTGGIRFYGDDHLIYNNYFENLAGANGEVALAITNGDADSGSSDLTKHFRPRRAKVVHNTFVKNVNSVEFGYTSGGSYTKPPNDIVFANNIIVSDTNNLIRQFTAITNLQMSKNILYPYANAVAGFTTSYPGVVLTNPLLMYDNKVWRIPDNSPARDSSLLDLSFVTKDMDGQDRLGVKDIGADEYSSGAVNRFPLTASDVGPNAEEFITDLRDAGYGEVKSGTKDGKIKISVHPNPFSGNLNVEYADPSTRGELFLLNVNGEVVKRLIRDGEISGRAQLTLNGAALNLASGIYYIVLKTDSSVDAVKISYIK